MPLSVLIVDDEPLARERLRALLDDEPDVKIVGECANGRAAVKAIQEKRPDLVFLDVQMPGVDGFGVVEQIGAARMPAIVFVTAFDQYALKAFEVHALDYLLKPFDRERFQATLARARKSQGGEARLRGRVESLARRKFAERLLVKCAGKERLAGDPGGGLVRGGRELREDSHRRGAAAVTGDDGQPGGTAGPGSVRPDPPFDHRESEAVKELEPWFHGDYVVRLHDGQKLTLSRSHRSRLLALLNSPS